MDIAKWALLGFIVAANIFSINIYAAESQVDIKEQFALLKEQMQQMEKRLNSANSSKLVVAANTTDSHAISDTSISTTNNSVKKAASKHQSTKKPSSDKQQNDLPLESKTASVLTPISWQGADISFLLAGGASAGYTKAFGVNESFNILDLNPLILFTYKDLLLMRSALDFAINDQGGTDVSLDNLNLNLFINDYMIFGVGKFDSSLGSFVQNISPSWVNRLPDAPPGFNGGQAAPQAEVGIQLRGGIPLTADLPAFYTLFLSNGSQGMVDTTSGIINNIATDGYVNNYGNYITGARFGIFPIPKLQIGVSGAIGKLVLINMADGTTVLQRGRNYNVVGMDAAYKWNAWDLRAEFIKSHVPSQSNSISTSAETWKAWYMQVAYWIPTTNFEPVIRYGAFNAPLANQNQTQWSFGLDYWLASSLAIQAAYELNHGQKSTSNNTNNLLIQLVFGY